MHDQNKLEKEILEYWKKNNIYKKVRASTKGNKPFYFLQGPPYTSGYLHIGQAWNNSAKDAVLRYKQMQGFEVWDRAGYDMHGLPTAAKVQKKLNLKTKEDIEKYGVDKFIQECMDHSLNLVEEMNKDLTQLGVWLDLENAYLPISEEWIESVWHLIKTADEKKRLYEGERTMTWCAECATALAKHECDYKEINDESIYVKFKLKEKDNEYLVIWTTTPWTIPFNLAVMVNPDIEYIKAKVDGEVWVIAKELADNLIKEKLQKEYSIIEEFKGKELEHMEYDHPLDSEINDYKNLKEKHSNIHTVLLSKEYVTLEAGSGLVHCAPGCGPEDYEVGHANKIPPYNKLNEEGIFKEGMGNFSGLRAKTDDNKFIQALEDAGALITKERIKHDYPHCERCKSPVVFRTTKQWFFKVEDLKGRMLELNKKVHWVPQSINNSYISWLENLRDNSITKQRFWGTPLPVWRCRGCKEYRVIESKQEIIDLTGKAPKNLHRPWIDEVEFDCKCGDKMKRIPDILDVWLDAGVAPYACLYYPQKKELFEKLFPPEFIIEGRDQVRGWFNLLMIVSTLMFDEVPSKAIYAHGMINDIDGEKMSKSLGNIVSPREVIEKYGTDAFRSYIFRTNAGEDVKFSWDEIESRNRNISILWNVYQYLIDYSKALNIKPNLEDRNDLGMEEEYILSRLNKTIKKVTELYEFFNIDQIPAELEKLFLDLSRNYMQYTREKISTNPELVLSTIYKVLFELTKMFSTVCPFITEKIYLGLKEEFGLEKETISLYPWPKHNPKLINEELEEEILLADQIIQAGLSSREKVKLGVRWPLKELKVTSQDSATERTIENLQELIKSKLNIKKVSYQKKLKEAQIKIMPHKSQIGKDFKQNSVDVLKNLNDDLMLQIHKEGDATVSGFSLNKSHIIVNEFLPDHLISSEFSKGNVILETETTLELETEGFARELMRRVQDIRKENNLKKQDTIKLAIVSDLNLEKWVGPIKSKVGAEELDLEEKTYPIKEKLDIKGKKFIICIKLIPKKE